MNQKVHDHKGLSRPLRRTGIRWGLKVWQSGMPTGALVGLVLALVSFVPAFLAGTGARWLHPADDHVAYLVSWRYFVTDAWHFPLFVVPEMGFPEGGSVLFNDGLPLAVLPTKVVAKLGGPLINPFGLWILLTYMLQGAMAARFVRSAGVSAWWAGASVAMLAVMATPFASRVPHIAISSHFLLLWALVLYLQCYRTGDPKLNEQMALSVVTLLVNAYLFVMVTLLQSASLVALATRGKLARTAWGPFARWAVIILGVIWVSGYSVFLTGEVSAHAQGFGRFSWNLPTLVVPPRICGYAIPMARDATGGQYEGESYIGLGALLCLLAGLWASRSHLPRLLREHGPLLVILGLLAALAASTTVYAGSHWLIKVNLPDRIENAIGSFRASGRFIWPLAYTLILVPPVLVLRMWPRQVAAGLLVLAVLLQYDEWHPSAAHRRLWSALPSAEQIQTQQLNSWMLAHKRVFQFPSYSCGGIQGPVVWGSPSANLELQLQWLAAQSQRPMNSIYTSRMIKNCAEEARWAQSPSLESGVLYLLSRQQVAQSSGLLIALRSLHCADMGWGLACSVRSLQ